MNDSAELSTIWDEACRRGLAHTAYGLLADLLTLWDDAEDALEADPDAPDARPGLREALARMLGDADEWRRLWEKDQDEFDVRVAPRIAAAIDARRRVPVR